MMESSTVLNQDIFPSFASMRSAHEQLLQRRRADGENQAFLDTLTAFVERARATGVSLDDDNDRWAAQSLIDYWSSVLYRADIELPDTTLAEFDESRAPFLDDALCPYRGLDAFHEGEHELFFGRQALVEKLAEKLQTHRFVAVVGASGSGKSSLVLAGLIPDLKAGEIVALPDSRNWRYFPPMVPGTHPLASLSQAVAPAPGGEPLKEAQFLERADTLARYVDRIDDKHQPAVLVVDQFEEVFTLCHDDAAQQAFIDNLIELAQASGPQHRVIVTMRADYEDAVARFPELSALFEQAQVRVTAMGPNELREAIEQPARKVGLKFDDGIVDALVKDILGEPAGLPLLQFTLLQLWNGRSRNRITWEAYRRLGNARKALAQSADELYGRLIPEEQETVKRILLKMVRPGQGKEVTSNRVRRDELYAIEAPYRVDRVLDKLAKARLIRADDVQVEVAHEALVRNWPQLQEWIDKEREHLRQRFVLTDTSTRWLNTERDPMSLLRGRVLEEAESYGDLNETEAEFVRASRAAAEAAEREKREAQRREIEAQADRKRARIATLFAVILTILLAIALATTGLAVTARREVEDHQRLSRSRELAAVAIDQIKTDPERAILIALAANGITKTYESQDALRQALIGSHLVAALRGHEAPVTGAQFSRDGGRIVTASDDQTARVWDVATGKELVVLRGHAASVNSAQFSRDGGRIVTASNDQTAQVWDAASGKELVVLNGHAEPVTSAQFSPDGQRIVTASVDKTARVWDAATGKELIVLGGHVAEVLSAQFSPQGKRIVTVSDRARVWDAATGQELAVLRRHTAPVTSAQFSPDDQRIVTASGDQTARVWDAASGIELAVLRGHAAPVTSAGFSPDGRRIVTTSDDKTARVWDAASGTELVVLDGHDDRVLRAQFSPDGRRIVTASDDQTVRVWNAGSGRELAVLRGHEGWISSAQFSPDGHWIITTSDEARVWDVDAGKELAILGGHVAEVLSARFSPDGQRIVTASNDQTARVWDAMTGKQLVVLRGRAAPITSARFSPDGRQIFTVSNDQTARAWDAMTGKELVVPGVRLAGVASAQFSPDGQRIAAGSGDTARVVDAASGSELAVLRGHDGGITSIQFSPDGQRIVTASDDLTARVWDATTGKELAVLGGHLAEVISAQFSPDGKWIVTASGNTARVMDAVSGEERAVLRGHEAGVTGAQFSPDGKQIITTSRDETARLWDIASSKELAVLRGHEAPVTSAQFSPNGKWIITASDDRTARVYLVTLEDLMKLAKTRVTRELTCEERVQYLREDQICPTPTPDALAAAVPTLTP